jgi:hypothetical protein
MVAALAVFLGTVPLRLGSMVDFLGFDADVVKLPDATTIRYAFWGTLKCPYMSTKCP